MEHFGTQEKRYYQPPESFGTEVRACAVDFSLKFCAKREARNNYQQFSTQNKRYFDVRAAGECHSDSQGRIFLQIASACHFSSEV